MQKPSKSKKAGRITALLCVLALCFTCFVFAPLEQYVMSQSELWFPLGGILPQALVCFALALAALSLPAWWLPGKARRVYAAVALGLAVCLYLQGNALNPDYGELDGRGIRWGDFTLYAIWSTALWAAILACCILLSLKKRKLFRAAARFAACAMLCVQAVTLAVVFITTPLEDKGQDWIVSDRNQFVLSQNTNTIMFVVDACDSAYIPQMLAESPDILEKFDGFTWYSDYAGSYSKTKMGLVYLLTNRWYENDIAADAYIDQAYESVPLYENLLNAGWDIRIYTADDYLSRRMLGKASNVLQSDLAVRDYAGLFAEMLSFSAFRYMPHIAKPPFQFYSKDFDRFKATAGEHQPYSVLNTRFMDAFAAKGVDVSMEENAFVVYHINGAHLPCNLDEHGRYVGDWNSTAIAQTKGVFRFLNTYFDALRASGLYDGANIIVTADHGRFDEGPVSPALLIKPAGAAGALKESKAMTSASDMHATISALCGLPHEGEAVMDIPGDADRPRRYLYYPTTQYNGGTLPPLTEYRVLRGHVFAETGVVYPGGAAAGQ